MGASVNAAIRISRHRPEFAMKIEVEDHTRRRLSRDPRAAGRAQRWAVPGCPPFSPHTGTTMVSDARGAITIIRTLPRLDEVCCSSTTSERLKG